MPYNPTIVPSPGLAPGINAISGAVQDWQRKQEKQQELMGYNDSVVQHAYQNGLISPEELQKYQAASLTQKTGIAAGYAANMNADLQRQQAQQQQQMQVVRTLLQSQEVAQRAPLVAAQARSAAADADAAEHAGATYYDPNSGKPAGVYDANGRIQLFGGADASGIRPEITVLKDPQTGKSISVLRRGPNQWDPITGTNNSPQAGTAAYDDQGNQVGIWNAKGTITKLTQPKAVDPQKAAMASLLTGTAPAPSPAAAPAAPQFQPGETRRQNGHTYQYDGTKWNLIQ